MASKPTVRAEQYTFLGGLVAKEERIISDAKGNVRQAEDRLAFFQRWRDMLKADICEGCAGHGYVRVWYAQDEVKAETCDRCKGTGSKADGDSKHG